MSKEYILICSCANIDKKADDAFELLFPGKTKPEVVRGKDRIYKLSLRLDNEHLKAISKLSGRFAYYVELQDNKIVKEYDLLRGTRIS